MRYFHFVIVNHVREVVGGKPVRFKEHKVVEHLALVLNGTSYHVVKYNTPVQGNLKPDRILLPFILAVCNFPFVQVAAMPVVPGEHLCLFSVTPHLFETLRRAVAAVCQPPVKKISRIFFIQFTALRLNIRPETAAHVRPLVPRKAEPCKTVVDFPECAFYKT